MPSRYEPCGLNQMYSLRYGTVPLVRHTGGLADTVERWDPERREGTGFVFYEFTADALYHTLDHAFDVWRDRAAWSELVRAGMTRDFSWERQSVRYVELYQRMLEAR
jgi:starch synthase